MVVPPHVLRHDARHTLAAALAAARLGVPVGRIAALRVTGTIDPDGRGALIDHRWPGGSLRSFGIPSHAECDFLGSISLAPSLCALGAEARRQFRTCPDFQMLAGPEFAADVRHGRLFEPDPMFALQIAEGVLALERLLTWGEDFRVRRYITKALNGTPVRFANVLDVNKFQHVLADELTANIRSNARC